MLYFYFLFFVVGPTQIRNQQNIVQYYVETVVVVVYSPNVLAAILVLDFAAFIKVSAWESNFLPARKLRTEEAASEALLVIINTKSFQKQQQPQFPKEKKKELEHQNYDQFWTQQFPTTYTNQYNTPGPVRKPSRTWLVLAACIQNGALLSSYPIGGFELAPRDVTRASTWVCATTAISASGLLKLWIVWYIY